MIYSTEIQPTVESVGLDIYATMFLLLPHIGKVRLEKYTYLPYVSLRIREEAKTTESMSLDSRFLAQLFGRRKAVVFYQTLSSRGTSSDLTGSWMICRWQNEESDFQGKVKKHMFWLIRKEI